MRRAAFVGLLLLTVLLLPALATPAGAADGDETVTIEGTVRDADDTALAGIEVIALNTNTSQAYVTNTSGDGTFLLAVPTGWYDISASSETYQANGSYQDRHVTAAVEDLDFVMTEILGTVTGHVTNGTTTVAGSRVVLVNEDQLYQTNTSAPLGTFTISNIQPGTYMIHAEKDGYQDSEYRLVEVARGETRSLNLTLVEQPSTLTGTVLHNDAPLSGVRVRVSSETGRSWEVTTSSGGEYIVSNIPAGRYTVTFTKSGYQTAERSVTLIPLEYNSLNVDLERSGLPVRSGFLEGYDLAHSLMIVGLALALVTLVVALLMRNRVRKKPGLLGREDE